MLGKLHSSESFNRQATSGQPKHPRASSTYLKLFGSHVIEPYQMELAGVLQRFSCQVARCAENAGCRRKDTVVSAKSFRSQRAKTTPHWKRILQAIGDHLDTGH